MLENVLDIIPNYNNPELELRLGTFTPLGFVPHVSEDIVEQFKKLDYLYSSDPVYNNTIEMYSFENNSKIRKILYFDENLKKILENGKIKTRYIKKKFINKEDFHKKGIRVSLSTEEECTGIGTNINLVRYKQRMSRNLVDSAFRVDITRVSEISISNVSQILGWNELKDFHYEVEIELVEKISDIFYRIKQCIYLIENLMNPVYHIHKILKTQKPFPFVTFNHFTNQTISLDHSTIHKIKKNYSVSEKIDGERRLLLLNGNRGYLIGSDLKLKLFLHLPFHVNFTLLDGEFYENIMFIFDVLIHSQKNICNEKFIDRETIYKDIVKNINLNNLRCKNFRRGENIFEICSEILNYKFEYPLDGLIFTPINDGYYNDSYKWKPKEYQTIDFLVRKNKDYYLLFVGIDREYSKEKGIEIDYSVIKENFPDVIIEDNYLPVLFKPDGKDLSIYKPIEGDLIIEDYTIIEFKYNERWIPTRNRTDKTKVYLDTCKLFGNDYKVAWNNWNIINNPVSLETITGEEKYFKTDSSESLITEIRKYNNSVKTDLYKFVRGSNSILEIAGGRGGDLWKIAQNGFSNATLLDSDINALFIDSDCAKVRYQKVKQKNNSFHLNLVHQSMLEPINLGKFDVVSCQFAIHYAFNSLNNVDALLNNFAGSCKKNGYLILTFMDGEKIFERLKIGEFKLEKDGHTCIRITKNYNRDKLVNVNQSINVFIDSIGDNKEYLVNYLFLKKELKKKGFNIIKESFFDQSTLEGLEKEFVEFNRYLIAQMT
jgi:ubiquinone/menaquinone biosynthesis C-methylase UbiE